ncbi:hypothetical protein MHK_004833, partial [Candidatus Magnetomorum sp. HK-1]
MNPYHSGFFAKNYKPIEYPEIIVLGQTRPNLVLDLNLEKDNFDPFSPCIDISQTENNNGFDLRVIKKNIYELKMTILTTDNKELPINHSSHNKSLKSTNGTIDDPYYYIWTAEEPLTSQTVQSMTDKVTINTIVFKFYDSINPSTAIASYTAIYKQYDSEIDRESTKPHTQALFEKSPESGGVYGEKT